MNTLGLIFGVLVIAFILFCLIRMEAYNSKHKTIEIGHFEEQGHVWVVEHTLDRNGKLISSERRVIPVDRRNW